MPRSFPDHESVLNAATSWGFREPLAEETDVHYRDQLADFVGTKDAVESCEIRYKVGWDQFNDAQKFGMIRAGSAIARGKG